MNRAASLALAVLPFFLFGCDSKSSKTEEPVAQAEAPAPAPPPEPEEPPAPRVPILIVDTQGPMIGGERVDVAPRDWAAKLEARVAELPVEGEKVSLAADRQAKAQHVAGLVGALGAAGASEVTINTQSRGGGQGALVVVPERLIASDTPNCAAIGMVRKDSSTAVWQIKGGTARRFSRGFAGPDLSMTFEEGLSKRIESCASTAWFFSAEDDVIWGLAFDMAERVTEADPPTKVTTTVLLGNAPVAGRPVKLAAD